MKQKINTKISSPYFMLIRNGNQGLVSNFLETGASKELENTCNIVMEEFIYQ